MENSKIKYQRCINCVMDNANDPDILFNEDGTCNYCSNYKIVIRDDSYYKQKSEEIQSLINKIKKESKNSKYDCLVGISGGVDSAFLVYKLHEMGLRVLAVHYDNGWNSETSTINIERLLSQLNIDLYTVVNDWEEFKDIQLSFLKAGVLDIELISDHGMTGSMFKTAKKFNIKYIFQGHNQATETILPTSWYHWKNDALNIRSIHKKFGSVKLKTFPQFTFFEEYYHKKFRKTTVVLLLNYIKYNKFEAQQILSEKFGWKKYGGKHNESIFTRFYQNYILPVKFKIDKRKAHLSSLICSGQISREQALEELKIPIWAAHETLEDKSYVIKKLGISEKEFDFWMQQPPVSHFAFSSYLTKHEKVIKRLRRLLGKK